VVVAQVHHQLCLCGSFPVQACAGQQVGCFPFGAGVHPHISYLSADMPLHAPCAVSFDALCIASHAPCCLQFPFLVPAGLWLSYRHSISCCLCSVRCVPRLCCCLLCSCLLPTVPAYYYVFSMSSLHCCMFVGVAVSHSSFSTSAMLARNSRLATAPRVPLRAYYYVPTWQMWRRRLLTPAHVKVLITNVLDT
jgi:hypothetical protein